MIRKNVTKGYTWFGQVGSQGNEMRRGLRIYLNGKREFGHADARGNFDVNKLTDEQKKSGWTPES